MTILVSGSVGHITKALMRALVCRDVSDPQSRIKLGNIA